MVRWTAEDRRRRLVARHLTGGVEDDQGVSEAVGALCHRVVALHATDPVGVYLQVQARLPGITADDVSVALFDDRAVVRTLAMRRTLFVVDPADLPMLQAAVSDKIAGTERRRVARWIEADGMADDGMAWMEAAEDVALDALAVHGPMSTRELRDATPLLDARVMAGSGKWAQEVSLASRVIWSLAVTGRAVRGRPGGSLASSNWTLVPTEDWVGAPLPAVPSVDEAAAALARRYLAAFGPATLTDLQWWTG